MTNPISVLLIAIVAAIALETVWYWHRSTRGSWRDWPAGRSLMYLLLIIGFGFGYGVINAFLGQYGAKPFVSFVLYLLFITALVVIRLTIRKEMRSGTRRLTTKIPTTTGPVDVTVATTNEESPHD